MKMIQYKVDNTSQVMHGGISAFEEDIQKQIDAGEIHRISNPIVVYPDGSLHAFRTK